MLFKKKKERKNERKNEKETKTTQNHISIHLVYVKRQRLVAQVLDSRGKLAIQHLSNKPLPLYVHQMNGYGAACIDILISNYEWIWSSLYRHSNIELVNLSKLPKAREKVSSD